nr:nuclear mitotic apparatus protein 1 isoform X2 [Paramormyrops kingsleyae]
MALHRKKEEALLNWINSLHLDSPIDHIFLLQDGVILVKLIHKLKKQEIGVDAVLELPLQGRLDFISAFLQKDCRYKADRGTIVSWDNIVLGKNLDVELSKVVVLLLYHSLMNGLLGLDRLGYDIELELADVLRFVLNNEDSLYLSDNLEKILKKQSIFDFSSASSSSFSDEESPVFSRRRRPEVQFLELKTVASSSVGSPIQDVLNTPQFRLRKLQKQLVQEREMRDELERELASRSQVITEREMQVSQLQHRVQRMMRDSEEQEQQPKEIEQLQRKNEGLLTRLHDVLKQCQELKTNKTQMERKIDDLTEENGILSVQMREIFSRLSSAEAAVQKLSAEQESSQVEWESKRGLLESELGQALSQKEYLNEQIQILQGKISILEDELSKAKAETLGGGEVMGPIMEWERLNQEIADLNHKLSQLQEIIIQLQKEKKEIEMMYEVEKTKFEAEKARLEELVSELNKMLTVQRGEREALEQALREQRVSLEAQIEALTADIASLTEAVQQRELAVTNFSQKVDVERKRVEKLTEEMEKQERFAQKTIQELHERVDHLGSVLNSKEEEARSNAEEWARERHEISRQQEVLMEARETISRERDAIATEYQHFQQEKEEVACKLNQQIVLLEEQQSVEWSLLSELRKEKQELEQKVSSIEAIVDNLRTRCHGLELDSEAQRASHQEEVESLKRKLHEAESILGVYEGKLADHQKIVEEHIALRDELSAAAECAKGLRDELEVERSKHKETLAAKLQSKSQMMEEMRELEEKTQNMSVEMQHLGQQLSKVQQEKMRVDASMAKLIEEGREVERGLTAARDQAFLTIKEREAETSKLRSEAEALSSKVILAEEAKAIELAKKDDEMQVLSKEMKQIQMELGTVKKAKDDMELDLQSSIEKRQEQLLVLRFQMNELEESANQKETEIEVLQTKLSNKDEELKAFCLHEKVEREELQRQLKQEEDRCLMYKQEIVVKDKEVNFLKMAMVAKEEEINSLMQSIHSGEEKASAFQDLQEKRHEEQKQAISTLEIRLSDAHRLLEEKASSIEMQTSQVMQLQRDLSTEQERVVSLEQSMKVSDDALIHCKLEKEALKNEVTSLQELAEKLKGELEELKREHENLRLQVAETETLHNKSEERIAQLQARLGTASALASEKDSQLELLHAELKERDSLRIQAAEMEARHKELEESIAQLQARLGTASALASEKDSQLELLHAELKERDSLRIQAAEMEARHKELEESIAQLQAQLGTASVLASEKDSQLESLHAELKERDGLRIQAAEMEARHKELEESIAQLQARLGTASALASGKQSELDLLHKEVREREKLRIRAVEVEEAQHKELEERVTEASTLASERKSQLDSLHNEMNEKDHVIKTQHMELESTVTQLKEQLHTATSLAAVQKRVNEKLNEDIRRLDVVRQESMERDALRIRAIEAEDLKRKEMEETIVKLKSEILTHTTKLEHLNKWHQQQLSVLRNENQTLLSMKESMVKEQEVSQRVKVSLESKLKLAGQELSVLLPLQECKAENERLIGDLQEQLQAKTEAMKHCKAQVQMAKTHYNGKKQQLLEVQEKAQTLENTLESRDQEVKVLRSEMKLLQIELDQAKLSEKDLALKVNSLQAQVDYADRQLREYAKHGIDTTLNTCKPPSQEERSEKLADLSKDSLDFCLDDSLSATRKPLAHEESSTPLVRSSERLRAKRRALGDDSIDTIFFTPMASNCPRSKLENSIMSLGELAIDSSKKSYSARRRTTQKTPGKAEVDGESSLFSSLHSAQSVPNIASQRNRPISMEFFDEPVGGSSDHLLSLPGYRRSTTHSHVPPRNINTYGVGAENEPDVTDDWKRIVELQARNKACLPHLKSSYPLESRPSLGMPLFNITDEDLRTGDPMETIRRASMLPDQIGEGVASRRSTMLPGQIGAGLASRRASVLPKPASVVGQNAGGSVFSLKRQGDNLLESDTPEAKKMPSCFPRPIQSKSPNTPAERRQSVMFSVDNTPHKNAKSSILQRGINKMRSSTRKSPGSVSKIAGSVSKIAGSVSKIPRSRKSPQSDAAKPQRRSPRINCRKSPKITASAKKSVDSTGRWQHYHADNGLPATNEDMIAGRVLVCPTASHPDKHQSN